MASVRRPRAALSALLFLASLAGCTRSATQLVVVVSTDVPDADYGCVRSVVSRVPAEGEGTLRGFRVPGEVELPFSYGVVSPGDDASRRVEVAVELRRDGCDAEVPGEPLPIVRRVVRTGFVRDAALRLPVFLADVCRGVTCLGETTCDPASGMCVEIPELAPTDLEVVRPGEELADAGVERLDASAMDAPLPDAPGLDAPASPAPDAPLPDAGPGCATVATVTGSWPTTGTLVGYSLTASPDGTASLRGLAFQRASADWAGAQDVASGGDPGSTYFPPPGTSFGPTGVAYNADASMRIAVFGQTGMLTVMPLVSISTDAFPGGRCPTSRCATRSGATDFAVLTGPANLTLRRITVSGRTASQAGNVAVAMGTTKGGVRPSASGVLVSYSLGGACFVERWPDFVARSGQVRIDDCVEVDVAELPGGSLGVGYVSGSFAVRAALIDAGLTMVGTPVDLDTDQSMHEPVMVNETAAGFRVSWVEDVGTPMVRSVGFDAALVPLATNCAAAAGDTLDDYRWLGAVRRGASSGVEWPVSGEYHGASFAD